MSKRDSKRTPIDLEGLLGKVCDGNDRCWDELSVANDAPLEAGAFILGCRDRKHRFDLPRSLVTRHVLLLGPSGSGKSRGFFMENCVRSTAGSLLVADPKGELWKTTSGRLPAPVRFAPREPEASACFNWIPLCRAPNLALRLAHACLAVPEVHGAEDHEAQVLLAAALFGHTASLAEPTPASAFDLLTASDARQLLQVLRASSVEATRRYASIVALAGPKGLRQAALGLGARLAFLADPDLRRFTSAEREAPDLAAVRRTPTALFWVVREDDMGALRPLGAMFFTALLDACKQPAGEVPVTFFLDEFANVCDVPDFETEITIARGRDIAFVVSIQSVSQLERRYGAANAHTIYENCQTTVALPGLSNSSAELVARSLGAGGERAALVMTDAVRRLGDDDMLVIMTNRPPLRLRRRQYEEEPCAALTRPLGPARTTGRAETPPKVEA